MKKTLGGSLFIRNAIKHDYCIRESIKSLAAMCDDVFILDCQSEDGTTEMLQDYISNHFNNVRYQTNGDWNCKDDYHKLSLLANMCIDNLDTDWHFMLQGDEVIHESSFDTIRSLINTPGESHCFSVRRFNLYGTPDYHIRLDLPLNKKPCSDMPIRLGRKGLHAVGDGESLDQDNVNHNFTDSIVIFHYGYVRKGFINVTKAIEMQTWFHGKDVEPTIDQRLLQMKEKNIWDPWYILSKDMVAPNLIDHPIFSKQWAAERYPIT